MPQLCQLSWLEFKENNAECTMSRSVSMYQSVSVFVMWCVNCCSWDLTMERIVDYTVVADYWSLQQIPTCLVQNDSSNQGSDLIDRGHHFACSLSCHSWTLMLFVQLVAIQETSLPTINRFQSCRFFPVVVSWRAPRNSAANVRWFCAILHVCSETKPATQNIRQRINLFPHMWLNCNG